MPSNGVDGFGRFRVFLILGGVTVAITGCEPPPPVFGVPQDQWNTLNDSERSQVIQGYNERHKQATANEPWIEAIGLAGSVLADGCHNHTDKSQGTSRTTTHTHELPNGWETKSKTKSSGFSFSSPC